MKFFAILDAIMSVAVKETFAETAVLHPRISTPYAERAPDPEHAAQSVEGVFSAGPGADSIGGQQRGRQFIGTTRFAALQASFWIAQSEAVQLVRVPQVGDLLTMPGRAAQPGFAISRIEHSDMGDLNLMLVIEDDAS